VSHARMSPSKSVPLKRRPILRWIRRALLVCLLGLLVISFVERRALLAYLGNSLIYRQPLQHADLIVVLGGNFFGERVVQGADLETQGYAPLALFSGGYYQGNPEGEVAIAFLAQRGYPRRGLESFSHDSKSTIDEATSLRAELVRRHAKRVILVTSSFHSLRTAIVFRLFCPGIQFISIPAAYPEYHADTWWMDPGSRRLFFSEWAKILGTFAIAYPAYLIRQL
jgi:uncharacterized SAM-binding protein YcdF (DUF218 family)